MPTIHRFLFLLPLAVLNEPKTVRSSDKNVKEILGSTFTGDSHPKLKAIENNRYKGMQAEIRLLFLWSFSHLAQRTLPT
jgi:hypothetical protein